MEDGVQPTFYGDT